MSTPQYLAVASYPIRMGRNAYTAFHAELVSLARHKQTMNGDEASFGDLGYVELRKDGRPVIYDQTLPPDAIES